MRKYLTYFCLLILLCQVLISKAQISGKVFRDYDADGKQNLSRYKESGFAGVKVRAYDASNFLVVSTNTDTEGNFQLNVPQGQKVRIEFDNLPNNLFPTRESSVRYAESPNASLNLGLNKSGSFAGKSPIVLTPVYAHGNPLLEKYPATNALVGVSYFSDDKSKEEKQTSIAYAKHSEIGSVWGIAYDTEHQKIYSSAFLKRHSGFGKAGISGIYLTDALSKETKTFLKLSEVGIEVGIDNHEGLTANLESQSPDAKVFEQIGKVGLGGMDVSDDGKYLYVMNLFDKNLYQIETELPNKIKKFELPNDNSQKGVNRPFAVKYYQGNVYVGLVNDASISQKSEDLLAKVYKVNLDNDSFKEVISLPLNYERGKVTYSLSVSNWNPWTDDFKKLISVDNSGTCIYPQPILSDIEFDEDGSMILGFMDRTGHQIGVNQPDLENIASYSGTASGDILRCFPKKKTQFISENNSSVGELSTEGTNNKQGPEGGEFYFQEQFKGEGIVLHEETGAGGIALLAGTGQVLNSVHEPTDEYDAGGVKWYDNQTGKSVRGVAVFGSNQVGTFKKLNGVGDVEIATEIQPILVNSRLWIDCNENGLQDPDEQILSEKEVSLYQKDKLVATLGTDKSGLTTFEQGLKPFEEYELRVSLKQNNTVDAKNLQLTKANNATDNIDNDAEVSGEFAVIKFKTGNYGENIFSLDFGFQCLTKPSFKTNVFCSNDGSNKVARVMLSSFDNNNRFILQKSTSIEGSFDFKTASEIPQGGLIVNEMISPNQQQDYTIRIYQPNGCFTDAQFTLSEQGCLRANEDNGLLLNLYPNPATDKISVTYLSNDKTENISLLLYDVLGRVVNQRNLQGSGAFQTNFDISKLTNGTYILGVQDGSKRLSRAFVKEQ